ncbi:MAG: ribosome biogenesis GTPase YlqF [Clostridiales bacterium]|jgi:ribosome biogenesis GTPase A|nr:ribosome biogenesis GTPase YlqF [Clostridiales bacterium]
MNVQWYPGHMAKARRMMQENIKLIDVIIELVDARIPLSSKNPDIDTLAGNKSRVLLLNKYDMADRIYNEEWKAYFMDKGYHTALINSKSGQGVKQIKDIVYKACEEKIERDRRRGIINRPVRAMVVGIPNVGKSTFINSFVGRASARTGNKPGVTKGKQWIRLSSKIELLDTPGILWPKFEDPKAGMRLAFIGSINDDIIHMTELSLELILFLYKYYPNSLKERYDIQVSDEPEEIKDCVSILEQIALKRSCVGKGGKPDIDRAAQILMDDFRNVRLGQITLEFPND